MTKDSNILYELQVNRVYIGKEQSISYDYNVANIKTADQMFGWYRPSVAFLFNAYFRDEDCDDMEYFCNDLNGKTEAIALDMIEERHCSSFNCDRSDTTRKATEAFLCFLNIVMSVGNCSPVSKNPGGPPKRSPEGFELDGWDRKLWRLKRVFYRMDSLKEFGIQERNYYELNGGWEKYCKDYYFQDFIDLNGDAIRVATGMSIRADTDWEYPSSEIFNSSYMLRYFVNATKLIIQRGYRIENRFYDKWTEERAKEVRLAFKDVVLPEDEDVSHDKNGLRYSIIGEWEE